MTISKQLELYRGLSDDDVIARIYAVAAELADLRVIHYNTTAEGGGVAEILNKLLPIMDELGLKHLWKVVPLDERSSHFTAHLVDLLQGNEPGTIEIDDRRSYLKRLGEVLEYSEDHRADLYFIHDFQLAPLAALYPWMRPAIWFCHIDTAQPNQDAKQYILDYLGYYSLCCFNGAPSVFPELSPERAKVIRLGIDPFRTKNKPLTQDQGRELLAKCGIDLARPLICQVSRFGRWKNPWQVIDIYRLVKQYIPEVQVALVGAMEAADDIDAQQVLADVRRYAQGDPSIHLLYDPQLITHQEVNAFQRYADVMLQRSTREGFGLTVTEAMWKNQPIVGTTATGLRAQVIHEYNGYLVDDTEEAALYTLQLLRDRELWLKMGEQAHEHVRQNFLFPTMILDYLEALASVARQAGLLSSQGVKVGVEPGQKSN
jgi:trehalose synthase